MRRKGIAGILVACAFSMMLGLVPRINVTFALLNARTANPNTVFAATALYAPGNLQASPSGRSGALSWGAGQNGSGYKVLGLANGTSSACPASTNPGYSAIGTATSLSYTDANRSPTSVPQGTWYCYQVQTTYQSWSSVQNNPVAGAQLGVVATGVQYVNANAARLDTGDRFIFTFNQPIDPATGPITGNTICSNNTTIWVGSTSTGGNCTTNESATVGRISGGTLDQNSRWAATYVWSNSNTTLTVTLGARTRGAAPIMSSATWTFTPSTNSSKLLSSAGGFHICDSNVGGGNCVPVVAQSTGSATGAPQGVQQSAPADAENASATVASVSASAATATKTRTAIPSYTVTRIPTSTSTVASATEFAEASPTPAAPSPSATRPMASATATSTATATATATASATASATATSTATSTATATLSPTATRTATATATETATASPTVTETSTSQPTATAAGPCTATPTATTTPGTAAASNFDRISTGPCTGTATPTPTGAATGTGTAIATVTATVTETIAASPTATRTTEPTQPVPTASPEATTSPTEAVATATPSAGPPELQATLTPTATSTVLPVGASPTAPPR